MTKHSHNLALVVSSILLISCGADNTASRITLGTSGTGIFDYTDQQYQMPFALIVTNTQGNAAANQKVTLKVVPIQYYKGDYVLGAESWGTVVTATCTKEDTNQNGILDAGEDINGNGHLDPTNPAVIAPHPEEEPTLINSSELITDEWGNGYFSLIYPKAEANWVQVQITASTQVTGTEAAETLLFNLPASVPDMESIGTLPPSGDLPSKYGQLAPCSDPN